MNQNANDPTNQPQNDVCAAWIGDLLKQKSSDGCDMKLVLRNCGRACAMRTGHIAAMKQFRALASGCESRADYVKFLQEHLQGCAVEEVDDGIVVRLNKTQCGCPMYPRVADPALCDCTAGNNQATWSEFFGSPVDVDVVESFLRGGKDCVLKINI